MNYGSRLSLRLRVPIKYELLKILKQFRYFYWNPVAYK